ncbi:MAG: hypothetical protein JNL67_06850 [Planctomycetaceae bacterium]|nr:hypothetical protein [Planctomycetaceae bacterium]
MNRPALFVLALLPILFSSGCLGLRHRPLSYRNYERNEVVQADYQTADCDSCGEATLGSCETGHCDRCEGGTHLPVGAYAGMPLAARLKHRLACGDGCGEVYIGEWISTPPTPDPCDYDGNYTGVGNHMAMHGHMQPVRSLLRKIAGIRFFGTRYADQWIDETSCCGEEGVEFADSSHMSSNVLHTSAPMADHSPVGRPACNCGH